MSKKRLDDFTTATARLEIPVQPRDSGREATKRGRDGVKFYLLESVEGVAIIIVLMNHIVGSEDPKRMLL